MRLVETGRVPDTLLRLIIRAGLARGRWQRRRLTVEQRSERRRELMARFASSPIAVRTQDPNRQHYELPAEFFRAVLGPRLKYSCAYWPPGVHTLAEAEAAMLHLTCERAGIADGMDVLDLGCGWGALALWLAERYPTASILAVSNSRTQKAYIQEQARGLGFRNLEVMTADVVELELERQFDRVVSVEMFEHMKNYGALMARIASWLKPSGQLFVHIFSHRDTAWEFDAGNPGDWMAQTFFSGGTMPSDDLLLYYQDDLRLLDHWCLDGGHYARTLRAWLGRLDREKERVRSIIADTYGQDQQEKWLAYWRLFFIACECAWASAGGRELLVSHYLFEKPKPGGVGPVPRAVC